MKSLLFVCLGNICRSPLAEGIAKKIILEKKLNITVDSAGTGDWHIGDSPCHNSIKVAALHGVDISSQQSRQVTLKDFQDYELIIGLDDSNMTNLNKLGAKDALKLGSFGYKNEDVPDPYFFDGFEGFEKVYEMIESCVTQLLEEKLHD
ncbi:low molecular weight phosphotyrosine protein phosphatase [Sulfurimonas sp. MAG313]|nr:low molecular weight protein-tyrosine-phosphatase [Sulfurimonas sp. MAG313]MDF1880953.1 low molecular weight phosphotyrosine protein phosphatase [Sulfurimonas sp. MAG313]